MEVAVACTNEELIIVVVLGTEAEADLPQLFLEASGSITEALEDPSDGGGTGVALDLLRITSKGRCRDEEFVSLDVERDRIGLVDGLEEPSP